MRTEEEIIKALTKVMEDDDEGCDESYMDCTECPKCDLCQYSGIAKNALELIAAKDTQIAELHTQLFHSELTISGVMHFVDKWLEGKELKQPPEVRAATMREKTLSIIESLQK